MAIMAMLINENTTVKQLKKFWLFVKKSILILTSPILLKF